MMTSTVFASDVLEIPATPPRVLAQRALVCPDTPTRRPLFTTPPKGTRTLDTLGAAHKPEILSTPPGQIRQAVARGAPRKPAILSTPLNPPSKQVQDAPRKRKRTVSDDNQAKCVRTLAEPERKEPNVVTLAEAGTETTMMVKGVSMRCIFTVQGFVLFDGPMVLKVSKNLQRSQQEHCVLKWLNQSPFAAHVPDVGTLGFSQSMVRGRKMYVLTMERITGVDLFDYLVAQDPDFDLRPLLHPLSTIARTLEYTHESLGMGHMDIGLENIMINPATLEMTLIDWELSTAAGTPFARGWGRLGYLPPEATTPGSAPVQDYAAWDCWSFGMILYALVFRYAATTRATMREILRGDDLSQRPHRTKVHQVIWDVMRATLGRDPWSRADMGTVAEWLEVAAAEVGI